MRRSWAGGFAAGIATALTLTTAALADTTVPVDEGSLDAGGGWYTADTRAGGNLYFDVVDGQQAAVLEATTAAGKQQLFTDQLGDDGGTLLADVTGIGYSTYRLATSTGFVAGLPSINLRVDSNGDGVVDTYLVYEPYQDEGSAAVQTGTWQDWDAFKNGAAKWWGSHLSGVGCGQATPCTWAQIVVLFPNARILEDPDSPINSPSSPTPGNLPGSFGVNVGSGNAGISGAVDSIYVAVSGDRTTFDFRNRVTLTGPEACRDGGWTTSTNPVFRNQGDCVSYFASGGHTD